MLWATFSDEITMKLNFFLWVSIETLDQIMPFFDPFRYAFASTKMCFWASEALRRVKRGSP